MKPGKLVLSRKGFDSKAGGCPSPIFPDGSIYSLPIPSDDFELPITYGDLSHGQINIGQVAGDLTHNRHGEESLAGLDPDIRQEAVPRNPGWQPIFGQTGGSQTHLENQGVAPGDFFLFFGLFRRVEKHQGHWRFMKRKPNQHILWGWLQIEQICRVEEIWDNEAYKWATYHCHFSWENDPRNTLYVATPTLDLGNSLEGPGAGIFPRTAPQLVLTEPGKSVSNWRLPRWFYPDSGKSPLSYHPDPTRWNYSRNHAYLQSVGRGQEFVLDLEQYPEALEWAFGLIRDLGRRVIAQLGIQA